MDIKKFLKNKDTIFKIIKKTNKINKLLEDTRIENIYVITGMLSLFIPFISTFFVGIFLEWKVWIFFLIAFINSAFFFILNKLYYKKLYEKQLQTRSSFFSLIANPREKIAVRSKSSIEINEITNSFNESEIELIEEFQ
jgi:hypothetical protein